MRMDMARQDEEESDEAAIVRAVLRLARRLRRSAPASEVTGGGLALLAALYRGGTTSAVTLARGEGLQPQSLSRLLARLERDGLVERRTDATDRRRQAIAITPHGLAAFGRAMRRRRRWLADIMAERLDPGDRATLLAAAKIMLRIAADDPSSAEGNDHALDR